MRARPGCKVPFGPEARAQVVREALEVAPSM